MREGYFDVLERLSDKTDGVIIMLKGIDGSLAGWNAILYNEELIYENLENKKVRQFLKFPFPDETTGIIDTYAGRIFYEHMQREKRMVICGGGHISIPLIQMGKMLGFSVTVLEDRPKFANHARSAGATEVICDNFENALSQIQGNSNTYFIIVTRGHRYDQVCLEMILKKRHAYIGMIGSRVRVAKVKEGLLERGADRSVLESVYTPIGLSIGAETPEEIAVSIMAQIIEIKNQICRGCGYPQKLQKALAEQYQSQEEGVLATIVTRRGSAPRTVGTKMLICGDGSCVGTVGGGCVEARVRELGIGMLRSVGNDTAVYQVDMTQEDAEDEGMVCGGIIELTLEKLSIFQQIGAAYGACSNRRRCFG